MCMCFVFFVSYLIHQAFIAHSDIGEYGEGIPEEEKTHLSFI